MRYGICLCAVAFVASTLMGVGEQASAQDQPSGLQTLTELPPDRVFTNGPTSNLPPFRTAKTLFSWRVSSEELTGDDEDEPDRIETDRPDFTEASSTVGKGRVQLETGYTFFLDRDGDVKATSHSFPETILRIGMLTEWFELRLGWNHRSLRERDKSATPHTIGNDGVDFLYLGAKLALTEQQGVFPEMALMPQMTLPTGAAPPRNGLTVPGVNWLYGWDINDFLSMGGSTQFARIRDEESHDYLEFAQSITIGYRLADRVGAYTEWFTIFPHGAIEPDVKPQHYLDGGFTYLVHDNFQLDIRAGVGLNRAAGDLFAGSGLAFRY